MRIVGRRAEKAEEFVAHARKKHPHIDFVAGTDVRSSVDGAELVCTVTNAAEPVLFGDWIAPGTHLNVVGASIPSKREIDEDLVAKSALFVDYRPSTFAQAGEVIGALESGRIRKDHVLGEIGEVVAGTVKGRSSPEQITLYRSLGIAAQDLACAHHCMVKARQMGLGVEAKLD